MSSLLDLKVVSDPYLPKDAIYWFGSPRRPDESMEDWHLRCAVIYNVALPEDLKKEEKSDEPV